MNYGRAFAIGIALNLAYVGGEAVAGIVSGSLALLADAGHNLGDVLGLALSWGAAVLSRRQPSGRFTYGLRSSSILAALANAIILLVVTGGIAWEAIWRISHPVPVASGIVIAVAAIGIVVNGGTALLFASGAGDLNVKSAFLHLAADALVTAGVVAAGIAIWLTGWLWLDPAVSLVVSAVIVFGTWGLVEERDRPRAWTRCRKGSTLPRCARICWRCPGSAGLHDLHIWGMSTTETALTCHLIMPDGHPGDAALNEMAQQLHHRFGIQHATIQIELADSDEACALTPEHVV